MEITSPRAPRRVSYYPEERKHEEVADQNSYPAKRAVWTLLGKDDYERCKKDDSEEADPILEGHLIEIASRDYVLFLGLGDIWYKFQNPENPTEVGKLLLLKAIKSLWITKDFPVQAKHPPKKGKPNPYQEALDRLNKLQPQNSGPVMDELIQRSWGEGTLFNWSTLEWKVEDEIGPYYTLVEGNTLLHGRELTKLLLVSSRNKGEEEFTEDFSLIILADPLEGRSHLSAQISLWNGGIQVPRSEVEPWLEADVKVSSHLMENLMRI
jgi:hypothetical protein